jgi:hypothetical protein
MIVSLPEPEAADTPRASGPVHLRYEDVCQDGRVALSGLPHAIGEIVWRRLLKDHPLNTGLREHGVVPMLTRLMLVGTAETVSVRRPLEGRGTFELAHTTDSDGAVNRVLLRIWLSLHGARARSHGPPPPGAGEPVTVGRVFAEHVFTRPFGPPESRKVARMPDAFGFPDGVPPSRVAWRGAEELGRMPDGVVPLDAEPVLDPAGAVFGLSHTDTNQHVNSLVYPRLFEEAALRRFAALGCGSRLLARAAEVAFRKPFFVGDRARIVLRAYRRGDRLGAVGSFLPETGAIDAANGPPLGRMHSCLQMEWEP